MTKKYYQEIDILKGIAIIMVLLSHAVIYFPINLHEVPVTKAIYDWVGTTHMPLFFFVSGFCFSYKSERGEYRQFIKKKIYRILIPFLVFNAIDIVPRTTLSFLVNRPKSLVESLTSILLHGGEYWFLYSLFMVFLFFPLIDRVIRDRKGLQIATIIICVILKFVPGIPTVFLIKRTISYLLYFVIGYVLKQNVSFERIRLTVENNKVISIIVFLLCILCWIVVTPVYVQDYNQLYGIVLACVGIVWSTIIAILMRWKKGRYWLTEFGKYSLNLYLLNGYTLVFSRTVMVNVLHCNIPLLIVLVNLIVTLLLGYIITRFVLDRFKLTKMLSGLF